MEQNKQTDNIDKIEKGRPSEQEADFVLKLSIAQIAVQVIVVIASMILYRVFARKEKLIM